MQQLERIGSRAVARLAIVAALALSLAAAIIPSALAEVPPPPPPVPVTVTVTNTKDAGPGSLRDAIQKTSANANPTKVDTIVFKAGLYGRISLSSPLPAITQPLTINGPGADRLTVYGRDLHRIFDINIANPASGRSVTINKIRLANGNAGAGTGGAVNNANASLSINRTTITASRGTSGGGVYSDFSLSVNGSTVYNSSATSSDGGGIFSHGPTSIVNSTIANNQAASDGGGIFASLATLNANAATVAGNRAIGGEGGGIASLDDGSHADPKLINTLVGNNSAPANSDLSGLGTDEFNAAYSLVRSEPAGEILKPLVPGTLLVGVDPKLAALKFNGGPTLTMALRVGSPATDRGSIGGSTACPGSDQRGLTRPFGGRCDIGAYELVRCGGVPVNRIGTPKADFLEGTAGQDGFLGFGGNDQMRGYDGRDAFCGGGGADRVMGGGGRDIMLGQGGGDTLKGSRGRDLGVGGRGADTVAGGGGSDRLLGKAGDDVLLGGRGNDRLFGGPGRDQLKGGPGFDITRQ